MTSKSIIIKDLGLSEQYDKVIADNPNKNIFVGFLQLLLITILGILKSGGSAVVAVLNEPPEGETYPAISPRSVYDISKNKHIFVNVYSREYVNNFAKENNLDVKYFDTPANKAINLALIETSKNNQKEKLNMFNSDSNEGSGTIVPEKDTEEDPAKIAPITPVKNTSTKKSNK